MLRLFLFTLLDSSGRVLFYAFFQTCTFAHISARHCTPGKAKNEKIRPEGRRCKLFQNNPYFQPTMPQGPAFQRPAYQAQQMYQQPMPMMQDGMIQARFVASREEAVAATVIPGCMFLFYDRANRTVYAKLIDPQTGMPDFRELHEPQPEQAQAPQYATMDAVSAAMQELEQRFDQKLSALQTAKQPSRKAVSADE